LVFEANVLINAGSRLNAGSETPGTSRNTELSEYQHEHYTSYVIANPALSADTDISLFLDNQIDYCAEN